MDCSPPGSPVHGILQTRILEWIAISFSRESSRPRDLTWASWIAGGFFTDRATREAQTKKYMVWIFWKENLSVMYHVWRCLSLSLSLSLFLMCLLISKHPNWISLKNIKHRNKMITPVTRVTSVEETGVRRKTEERLTNMAILVRVQNNTWQITISRKLSGRKWHYRLKRIIVRW